MRLHRASSVALAAALLFRFAAPATAQPAGARLPSWNDTGTRKAVVAFVDRVTRDGSPDFVPPAERIAVFDNDGTLWAEQPVYTQLAFALDRVKALAPQHPEWNTEQPFASLLKGDCAEREWACDRESPIGRLDAGLDEAKARGWTVVDMKADWKVIYPAVKR